MPEKADPVSALREALVDAATFIYNVTNFSDEARAYVRGYIEPALSGEAPDREGERWKCDWKPDDLNPGPDCPYCAGEMCARFDGLGCTHDRIERHGYIAAAAATSEPHPFQYPFGATDPVCMTCFRKREDGAHTDAAPSLEGARHPEAGGQE